MTENTLLPLVNIHSDDVEAPLIVCMCIIGWLTRANLVWLAIHWRYCSFNDFCETISFSINLLRVL